MRKIKFRGYNIKNQKWLYGYYLVNRGKHFVVEDEICTPGKTWEDFEVDPESVGQFVCFIDGVDVYEGDIIRKHYTGTFSENDIVGVVTYLHAVLMWYLVAKDRVVGTLGHTTKVAKHTIIGNEYEMKNDLKHIKENRPSSQTADYN